jgi:hypothetical protein
MIRFHECGGASRERKTKRGNEEKEDKIRQKMRRFGSGERPGFFEGDAINDEKLL